MAPRRNKKKAASNPARGFSTTSVPSRTHEAKQTPPQTESPASPAANQPVQEEQKQQKQQKQDEQPKDEGARTEEKQESLSELTPEQLEEHLKDAELQSIVDKYGAKCSNEYTRQVSKLEGEKRLLRGQAMSLSITDWLPTGLLDEILEQEKQQLQNTLQQSLPASEEDSNGATALEEDLCVKLWVLRETLLALAFSEERVEEVLPLALHTSALEAASATKEYIWGLDSSLRWLALHCSPDELPTYRQVQERLMAKIEEESSQSDEVQTPEEPRKPGSEESRKDSGADEAAEQKGEEMESSESEYEYDGDPENLLPMYISLKSRLYQKDPSLFNQQKQSHKKDKKNKGSSSQNPSTKASAKCQRLQNKIAEIESDILFDKDLAEAQWQQKLWELRQQSTATQQQPQQEKQDASEPAAAEPSNANDNAAEGSKPSETDGSGEGGEEDDILGRMFGMSMDVPFPEEESPEEEAASNVVVTIRDFGKPSGMSPRRILEDSCRSRDSASKVTFKALRTSSYSNRQEVQITWSKLQEPPPPVTLGHINYVANAKTIRVTMESIATPTSVQAEWYIATVALFLVFSHMPKERKASMKLPPAFKDLFNELVNQKKEQDDAKSKATLRKIQTLVQEHIAAMDTDVVLTANFRRRNAGNAGSVDISSPVKPSNVEIAEQMNKLWVERASRPSYRKMEASRKNLPIWDYKEQILETLDANQVVIISSETGSGKSTQIPSFILEHELSSGRPCKIWVTEPRRISAISLARRVSEELGERHGDVGTMRSLIGYAIRLESKMSASSRLVFATTGVVVRMLERPKDFEDITHIVLDEVHERTIDSDFLLIILRRLLHDRPDLKLVLMSATVDASRFSTYLDNAPVLNVPGRTFPVEVKYLEDAVELTKHAPHGDPLYAEGQDSDDDESTVDAAHGSTAGLLASLKSYSKKTQSTVAAFDEYQIDYGLIVSLLAKIATEPDMVMYSKAILIFMPGLAEIRKLYDEIVSRSDIFGADRWIVHALHSSIASDEQDKAFLVPPEGMRKIVIATNIAETGITIPDITAVVDTGKEKVMRFDEKRQFSRLVESFISRANAKQRRGRAGRVQAGLCFHMFTKHRHDNLMNEQQTPEMLRLSLQDLVLRVKICKLGNVEQTLSEALDPPLNRNIRRSIEALKDVKALTGTENLTFLGRPLAKLPVDVFLGKLIIYGIFFKCLDAAITIAAILSSKSPFVSSVGSRAERDNAKLAFKRGNSDLLTVYNAYLGWRKSRDSPGINEFAFCRKHNLSIQALSSIEDIKVQLVVSLVDAGLLELNGTEKASMSRARFMSGKQRYFFKVPDRVDKYSGDDMVVNSVIAWSFYPRLLVREGKGWRNVANNQNVKLQFTSVNRQAHGSQPGPSQPRWKEKGLTSALAADLLPPYRFLSFYHMTQSQSRAYQAHETSAVDDFAVALLCGELDVRLHSGVLLVDGGSRARFMVDSWKTAMAMKSLGEHVRDALASWLRSVSSKDNAEPTVPKRSDGADKWMDLWEKVFGGMLQRREGRMHLQH